MKSTLFDNNVIYAFIQYIQVMQLLVADNCTNGICLDFGKQNFPYFFLIMLSLLWPKPSWWSEGTTE